MKKRLNIWLLAALVGASGIAALAEAPQRADGQDYIVAASVESFRKTIPDPWLMNHIHYNFGEINDTFDGLDIQNPARFQQIVDLKKINPDLKISISVGGKKRQGYSEMAADSLKRLAFARDVKEKLDYYGIDGIELDWEWPGFEGLGHTASEDDTQNYVKLVRDLRQELGPDKLVTFYSSNLAKFVDYPGMMQYVDYAMVGAYNLGMPPKRHQSLLYPSSRFDDWCIARSIQLHLDAGVPPEKIVLGIPFFARCKWNGYTYVERASFDRYLPGFTEIWDEEGQVPYYADADGTPIATFDNPRSILNKCQWLRDQGFSGVHYWNYDADDSVHTLARTLHDALIPQQQAPAKSDSVAGIALKRRSLREGGPGVVKGSFEKVKGR